MAGLKGLFILAPALDFRVWDHDGNQRLRLTVCVRLLERWPLFSKKKFFGRRQFMKALGFGIFRLKGKPRSWSGCMAEAV